MARLRGKRQHLVLAFAMASASGAGCSTTGSAAEGPPSLEQIADTARSRGHEWQADILSDGDITLAEYDEAHRRNLACLESAGLVTSEPQRNLPDGFRWLYDVFWEGMDDEDGQGAMRMCGDTHMHEVELAMSTWGAWDTGPALLAEIASCVASRGIDVSEDARNYRDAWLSATDQGLTQQAVGSCVDSAMQKLHPGVDYAVAF